MLDFFHFNREKTLIFSVSLLLLMGFVTSVSYFLYRGEIRSRTGQLKQDETHLVDIETQIVTQTLQELQADLRSLSGHHLLAQFLSSRNPEDLKGLDRDFLSFAAAKKRYTQIRLIYRDGREKLRINKAGSGFKTLPPDALQQKAHRYYTSEALALDPGQIYLSQFDLNIEHGRIQRPFEPMLRLVTPLADTAGEKKGLLVLNYAGNDLFSKLMASGERSGGNLMILNADGYWLKGPWPEYEWGFMLPGRKDKTFSRLFPGVWNAMAESNRSFLVNDRGIFTCQQIYPEKILAMDPGAREKRWTIVSWVSPEKIDSLTAPLKLKYRTLWGLLSICSLISAWIISFFMVRHRQIQKEIKVLALFPHENPSPIIRVDTRGKITYANPASAELLRCWGVAPGTALPAQLEGIQQAGDRSAPGSGIEIAAGEKSYWFLPAPMTSGGIYLYGRDITDLKAAREELEIHYRRQEAISTIFALALKDLGLKQFLSRALDTILELPCIRPHQRGAIFLTKNDGDILELMAYSGYPEESGGPCSQITMGKCVCGKTAQCREIVFAEDTDPIHHDRNENEPPHSHFCIPVLSRNKVLGVLNLHTEKEYTAGSREINFFNALAEALALIIEQKTSFKSLQKSKASLRKAQRISRLGNWDYDVRTGKIYWSDEIFRIFGVDPERFTVTYDAFLNMVHPDDRTLVEETVEKTLNQGSPYNIEHRVIQPQGELRIVRETGEAKQGTDGTLLGITGIVHDITEQERSKQEKILVKKVFNHAIEGISITDDTGAIEYVNKAFTRITGYTSEEVLGQNPRILKSERQPPEFYENMWKALTEKGHWQGEIWNRRKSGEAFPEWLSIAAIEDYWQTNRRYIAIFHDRSDLRRAEKEIEYKSRYDALTGLLNRDIFKDRLEVALSQMKGEGQRLAIFAIDLDDFKTVNNSLGHKAGDELLQSVSARLQESFGSRADIGRLGGDEFLILIQNLKKDEDTTRALEKIFQEVSSRPYEIQGKDIFITPSVGIALAPDDGSSADTLIQNADLAVDRSKKRGPNRYSYFSKAVGQEAQKKIDLLNTMRRSVDQKTFRVFYQPKTDAKTGLIKGMEALVRWPEDEPGPPVSPAVFIPLAEKSGLIKPLGDFVLKEACRRTSQWRKMGFAGLKVAVNLSVQQVLEPGLPQRVAQILKETALPAENLALEVTETALMNDMDAAEAVLREVNTMGIDIHLDDFGTGYSSLSYLRRLPVNSLKIDKSFVDDTPLDTEANTMITAIISMAHSLNLTVVAEGVETREQLMFLKSQGCDVIQGYFFSPPLPGKEFEKYIRKT